ncbi:hypothetical protein J437_LFUL014699 [Ladona fulva]|uniref:Reverse transcriptase domain-containing protein n=1 Tax=Ladona fulva TaxID=123851 RepID=A0A8K0KH87_LADFU|nr:hypothetical protein J437_LFUL014699 [Ladona fulva]
MEWFVCDKLSYYLDKFITLTQHGFFRGRSITSNLLIYQVHIPKTFSNNLKGSHLDTILFNFYINDSADELNDVEYFLYTDDLKIYRVINDSVDCEILQSTLNILLK